jgi:uncharacterized protein (TIGR00369 family)
MNAPASPARLFRKDLPVEALNQMHRDTACERLGIEITEIGPDYLRGRMPVDARTKQPAGILHGGASVALAETLGSVSAWLCLEPGHTGVGLDINANHIRAMREGWVYGECRPVHVGRTTHVWQIDIRDEAGRMVCTSRITMAIVPDKRG